MRDIPIILYKITKRINDMSNKIAIIGGSIAGCAVAIELHRLGYDITVFERSPSELEQRGTGIMLPNSLVQQLIDKDLLDKDFSFHPINSRDLLIKNTTKQLKKIAKDEYLLLRQPICSLALNWGVLFQNLHKRVPSANYRINAQVTTIEPEENAVNLTVNHDEKMRFDYVVCADGIHSLGRQILFSNAKPNFSGYIAWRGIFPYDPKHHGERLQQQVLMYLYNKGHALYYLIPGAEPDTLLINWVLYESLEGKDKNFYFTDKKGNKFQTTVAPDKLGAAQKQHLYQLANSKISAYACEIIYQTPQPFIQFIYDQDIPSYTKGRILLLGDASVLPRPHVASGATKALEDTLSLSTILKQEDNFDQALIKWNAKQWPKSKNLVALGEAIGNAMVTNPPDYEVMDEVSALKWWDESVVAGRSWYIIPK